MSTPETIYIVSGNIAEFKYITKKKWDIYHEKWAKGDKQEMYPNYKYVSSPDILKGLDEIKGFYYGTYEQRKDIEEIKTSINIIKSKKTIPKSTRIGATHHVSIDGIFQNPKDYTITFRDTIRGRETIVDFIQAPPAGSVINITEISTGISRFNQGNGLSKSYSYYL